MSVYLSIFFALVGGGDQEGHGGTEAESYRNE